MKLNLEIQKKAWPRTIQHMQSYQSISESK